MNTKLLYIFTRTPLHVGAGTSVGAVDQPVQRERHTGYPIIPGSSIKGVLADEKGYIVRDQESGTVKINSETNAAERTDLGKRLFGRGATKNEGDQGESGELSFSEAKLLAFPVRSAQGCFAWVTSPHLLKRWEACSNQTIDFRSIPRGLRAYYDSETLGKSAVFEDYAMEHAGNTNDFSSSLIEILKPLLSEKLWQDLLENHFAIVSDDMLAHFTRTCCEVAQHVVIDDETGTAKDGLLFNQENVPAETLFYSVITEIRNEGALEKFKAPNPIQFGGDATTGLGFCSTELVSTPNQS